MLQVVNGSAAPAKAPDTTHRELSWFAERVEKGRKEVFVEIVTITPAIAKRLLEANDGNRPLSERLVQEITADIEHGFWQLNGETIIVSKEGLLNDGQHRLEAIVRAGRPVQSAVMFGVPREARMTVDMGKQRSAANFLSMSGTACAGRAAAVARLLIFYSKGVVRGSGNVASIGPTKQDVIAYYSKHKKEIQAALQELSTEQFVRVSGETPFCAAYVILRRVNPVESAVFFQRVCDGAGLKIHDPILALRSRMTNERKNRLYAGEKLEIILRHWNRWRKGAKVTQSIRREGSYPEIVK
jgi:hypothetical protein